MHPVAILGSTGSIGTQTLEVVAANPGKFRITALAAHHNVQLLQQQIEYFKPDMAVLVDKAAADSLVKNYKGSTTILSGEEGLLECAAYSKTRTVVTSMVGFAGLAPTIAAINAGKNIALANKETLVAAGELVTALARKQGVEILPVDSEHSAILQCLQGGRKEQVNRLIITASGGPFRGKSREQLKQVTVEECLRHPNWNMGKKITVDSATLVNKGLEIIEAKWLFGIDFDRIEAVIHPQSIVHSMVEYVDGSILAQLGNPDMKVPIQYALSYPERVTNNSRRIDFSAMLTLTFEPPDTTVFPALNMAYQAGKTGGTLPCVLNAANEVAVYAFLRREISFLDILEVVKHTMEKHQLVCAPSLAEIIAADSWARNCASDVIKAIGQ